MSVVSRLEPWPSADELSSLRRAVLNHVKNVADAVGEEDEEEVQIVAAPYRVCPLGAHIDHQGGVVAGMALNCGVMVGFIPTPNVEDNHDDDFEGRDEDEDEEHDAVSSQDEPTRPRGVLSSSFSSSTTVCLVSDSFDGQVCFDLADLPPPGHIGEEEANWGAYARGAAWALRAWLADPETDLIKDSLTRGIVGVVRADPAGVDSGGISSSAAVGMATLMALQKANGIDPRFDVDAWENILMGQRIENGYLGLRSGVLDQASVMLSRRTALTLIDCKRRRHTHEPFGCDHPPGGGGHVVGGRGGGGGGVDDDDDDDDDGKGEWEDKELPFVILLAFSGLREALTAGTGYNQRVDECRAAAASLTAAAAAAAAGAVDSSDPSASASTSEVESHDVVSSSSSLLLSDVAREAFDAHVDSLPENQRRRATHYFTETSRVAAGTAAWRRGDLEALGREMTASGISSIENYECGCEPMNDLRAVVEETSGVLGVRFSGAGFRGCCVALMKKTVSSDDANKSSSSSSAAAAEEAARSILSKYIAAHPDLAERAQVVITRPGAGARSCACE